MISKDEDKVRLIGSDQSEKKEVKGYYNSNFEENESSILQS